MEPAPTALHGLNRDPSHTDIRLRKAAKDLETSFLAEMLKSAKILKMPDGFSGGAGEAHFQSYLVQGLAEPHLYMYPYLAHSVSEVRQAQFHPSLSRHLPVLAFDH